MSRRAPRALAGTLEELLARLAPPTLLAEVQRAWPSVVGPAVAREAEPRGERAGILTVACSSSVWAQELDLMGPVVVAGLARELGHDRVRRLRCVAGAPDAGRPSATREPGTLDYS